ncbi:HLA class II histocompatibility antigen, DM alpha chain isoform X2 [Heterocephalus glaber]|uniref:HLA class II histocompatibility antigen, DM alpha chain isoform X2 n=1 Tax=Heterocephalus glaber TaxID=10181 RepID=A0AAX6T5C9_HETGA|nr:HLA class II histocompatibility antigen, DM alpha chain isoform X2 [Heterocephalus glaber]
METPLGPLGRGRRPWSKLGSRRGCPLPEPSLPRRRTTTAQKVPPHLAPGSRTPRGRAQGGPHRPSPLCPPIGTEARDPPAFRLEIVSLPTRTLWLSHADPSETAVGSRSSISDDCSVLQRADSPFALFTPDSVGSHSYTPVWRDDLQNHTFRHTVFCQEGTPSIGLSESYDEDLLFSFDFSKNTRVPRLPDFADWAQDQSDAPAIAFDKQFCEIMVQQLDPVLDGQIPVSRGFPVPEVFTLKPLEFGKPNTLVCFVSNLFPPMLTVSWEHNSEPVEGVGPTFVSAVDGLSFQAFSYLNFTPEHSDVFSCMATHEIDRYTAIAYWVPHNALPSDLLENVLCGVAFGLGVLGIIVGTVLTVYFGWPCSGD